MLPPVLPKWLNLSLIPPLDPAANWQKIQEDKGTYFTVSCVTSKIQPVGNFTGPTVQIFNKKHRKEKKELKGGAVV